MNHNLSEVLLDELGLVKAMAIMGKGNEADDLDGLTSFTESAEESLIQNYFASNDSSILIQNGKDLLQRATARFVYDFEAYQRDAKPVVVSSIMREEHYQKIMMRPSKLDLNIQMDLAK